MALAEKLDNDFKEAFKARDSARLSILRLVRGAIKNLEIKNRTPASDEDIVSLLQRELKQHKETMESLATAGRGESEEMTKQKAEVALLETYLPPKLSSDDLRALVEKAIGETKAAGLGDLGRVMGKVMPQVKGRAAGDEVGAMVREILNKEKL